MLHSFFRIDKSPVLALAKNNFLKVTLFATIAGVLPISIAHQPAQAQFQVTVNIDGNKLMEDARNVITGGARGRFIQTYFGYVQPSGSQYMKRTFGSSADSKAHRICTDYYVSRAGYGWFVHPNSWWYIQTRYEGDRYNCFYRRYY